VLGVEEEINQRPRNILAYRSPSDLLDKSRTTEHSPSGGFRGVEGLHFRTRSARLATSTLDYWRRRGRSDTGGGLVEVEIETGGPLAGGVVAPVVISWPNGVRVVLSRLHRLTTPYGSPCSRQNSATLCPLRSSSRSTAVRSLLR
jgi:hypothetical protein